MSEQNETNWEAVGTALATMMDLTGSLSESDLRLNSKRLKLLSDFAGQLEARTNEALRVNVRPCDVDTLFSQFAADQSEILRLHSN